MLTAILLLAAAAAPAKVAATPIFAETPTGWRMGKATARAKLVEYGSLNCSHCAHFSEFAGGPIAAAVRAGRASFEFRPYLIFPHDVAATLIARCVPVTRRFGFVEAYYRSTGEFTKKLQAADPAVLEAARAKGGASFNRTLVELAVMKPLAARFGLNAPAVERCIAAPAGTAWLEKSFAAAKTAGVSGTPAFFLNGKSVSIASPEELTALLK